MPQPVAVEVLPPLEQLSAELTGERSPLGEHSADMLQRIQRVPSPTVSHGTRPGQGHPAHATASLGAQAGGQS